MKMAEKNQNHKNVKIFLFFLFSFIIYSIHKNILTYYLIYIYVIEYYFYC